MYGKQSFKTSSTASMRPQLIAADNGRGSRLRTHGRLRASMRPQLIAADNELLEGKPTSGINASMRPQLIAADNPEQIEQYKKELRELQ